VSEPFVDSPPRAEGHAFGPYRLIPGQHLLLRDGMPVRVGGRALAVLTLLVERAGALVTKRELMAHAWPGTVVTESSIKVAVSELRSALRDGQDGQRYLVNIPRRGYQFVAPVTRLGPREAAAKAALEGVRGRAHPAPRTVEVRTWCVRMRPSLRKGLDSFR